MANTGEVVVTKLRLYIDGNATKTVKRNAPGDADYIPPFLDTDTCIVNATAVTPTPVPVAPTPPTPVAPQTPTPTECFYATASVSTTAHPDTTVACADTTLTQTVRHDSTTTAFPNLGATVWTDCGFTTLANGYYKVNGTVKVFRVDAGRIVSVNNCVASSNMPCTGKNVDVFLSDGKNALSDFCAGTHSVNQTHLFGGAILADGLNQFICQNGQAMAGGGKYYIVSLSPYVANPSSNSFTWWLISGTGRVVEYGTYDCSCGTGSSGGQAV